MTSYPSTNGKQARDVFDAVCLQVQEVRGARERQAERLKQEHIQQLTQTIARTLDKPWLAREFFDASNALRALQAPPKAVKISQSQPLFQKSQESTCVRSTTATEESKDSKDIRKKRRVDFSAQPPASPITTHTSPQSLLPQAADVYQTLFDLATVSASQITNTSPPLLRRVCSVQDSDDEVEAEAEVEVDRRIEKRRTTTDEEKKLALELTASSRALAFARVQADVVDAMLVEHGLPRRFERKLRGDVCDICPGSIALRIAANDSLLECPRCGVARKLSSATAATAGAGNDKDYTTHTSGKQKSRVVDVLEISQGVLHKEPRPAIVGIVMETLYTCANSTELQPLLILDESSIISKTCESYVHACGVGLQDHANVFAAEVLRHGPFLNASDALARLQDTLPCLHRHLESLHYQTVYTAMKVAHDASRLEKRAALKSAAAASKSSDTAMKEEAKKKEAEDKEKVKTSGKRSRTALSPEQRAIVEAAKGINASYDLAAKVGATLSGFHGLRMLSQQREQIYALHGALDAEMERAGDHTRLPHRFVHEIRQLCVLLGLDEFLPLYPPPHPVNSAPLRALDDALKKVFERLGWEFTIA